MDTKDDVRERIWGILEKERVALFPGARGRIPNFKGAEMAARFLSMLPEWLSARQIKANPDSPQRPVRHLALNSGKTIYMAVPGLREKKCFIKLATSKISTQKLREASSIKGAFRYGMPVHPEEIPQIGLIVAGSVAVNRSGSRIGKGGGYSDLEYALAGNLWFTIISLVIFKK
jgi:5-formyltetrahydrofolate cyclo-ligase